MRRYHAVTWNHFNSSWSTHEPSPLFPFLVRFSLCIIEEETAFTDGENRNVSSGSKLCKNGTEADVVSLYFLYFSFASFTSTLSYKSFWFLWLHSSVFASVLLVTGCIFFSRCDVIKSLDQLSIAKVADWLTCHVSSNQRNITTDGWTSLFIVKDSVWFLYNVFRGFALSKCRVKNINVAS